MNAASTDAKTRRLDDPAAGISTSNGFSGYGWLSGFVCRFARALASCWRRCSRCSGVSVFGTPFARLPSSEAALFTVFQMLGDVLLCGLGSVEAPVWRDNFSVSENPPPTVAVPDDFDGLIVNPDLLRWDAGRGFKINGLDHGVLGGDGDSEGGEFVINSVLVCGEVLVGAGIVKPLGAVRW